MDGSAHFKATTPTMINFLRRITRKKKNAAKPQENLEFFAMPCQSSGVKTKEGDRSIMD